MEVARVLLTAHPEGTKEVDENAKTPLEIALEFEAPAEVAAALLEVQPTAAGAAASGRGGVEESSERRRGRAEEETSRGGGEQKRRREGERCGSGGQTV